MAKQTDDTQVLIVKISPQERESAKSLAKASGMTFQGWLGQLIKRELRQASSTDGIQPSGSVTGTSIGFDR